MLVEGDRFDENVGQMLAMTLHLLVGLLLATLEDHDLRSLSRAHDFDDDLGLARGDGSAAVLALRDRPKGVEGELLTLLSLELLNRDLFAGYDPELPSACFDNSVHRGQMIPNPTAICKRG